MCVDTAPAPASMLIMSMSVINITDQDEIVAVWAALCAMVEDVHAPQDNLTEAQWAAAERLHARLTAILDALPPGTVFEP